MNLPDLPYLRKPGGEIVVLAVVMLMVALGSFYLGRLSASPSSQPPATIVTDKQPASTFLGTESLKNGEQGPIEGGVVASRTGTKYYFPWCGSAQNISDSNKIWFQTTKEARAAGYLPAANCKGLE